MGKRFRKEALFCADTIIISRYYRLFRNIPQQFYRIFKKSKISLECYRDKCYDVIKITKRLRASVAIFFRGQVTAITYFVISLPPSYDISAKAQRSMIDGMLRRAFYTKNDRRTGAKVRIARTFYGRKRW